MSYCMVVVYIRLMCCSVTGCGVVWYGMLGILCCAVVRCARPPSHFVAPVQHTRTWRHKDSPFDCTSGAESRPQPNVISSVQHTRTSQPVSKLCQPSPHGIASVQHSRVIQPVSKLCPPSLPRQPLPPFPPAQKDPRLCIACVYMSV